MGLGADPCNYSQSVSPKTLRMRSMESYTPQWATVFGETSLCPKRFLSARPTKLSSSCFGQPLEQPRPHRNHRSPRPVSLFAFCFCLKTKAQQHVRRYRERKFPGGRTISGKGPCDIGHFFPQCPTALGVALAASPINPPPSDIQTFIDKLFALAAGGVVGVVGGSAHLPDFVMPPTNSTNDLGERPLRGRLAGVCRGRFVRKI